MGIRFNRVTHEYASYSKKTYKAIQDISLNINSKDEVIALVGHTGSGKSTLAKHMNALIFPTEGTVEIFGKEIGKKRNKKIKYNSIRKQVGLVFQFPEYQLFEETIIKDIMFGPKNFKSTDAEALEKANDIKLIHEPKVVDVKIGPRASSVDYFPMVGKLVDSKKTLEEFPHLKNGSHIKDEMISTIDNLYVLNGVGGRGYVLSPYLAKNLEHL